MKTKLLKISLALVFMVALSGGMLPHEIGPTEIGVKTNKSIIGGKGVQDDSAHPVKRSSTSHS